MDEWWVCELCHSLNRPNAPTCYSCRAQKGLQSSSRQPAAVVRSTAPAATPGGQAGDPVGPGFAAIPGFGPQAPGASYPQSSPYGVPAWGMSASPPRTRPRVGGRLLSIVVFIVVIAAIPIANFVLTRNCAGQVIFTTNAPTGAPGTVKTGVTCQVANQVTSVPAGTSVYADFFFSSTPSSDLLTITKIRNGTTIEDKTGSYPGATAIKCLQDTKDQNYLGSGTYEFKMHDSNGDLLSDGTLTIR